VKTGDGCATVTGYKLPTATAIAREGGSEVQARSQDTGPQVLVAAVRKGGQLLRKEKDEASQPDCFRLDL
jgi:hypothetical protein